MPPADVRVQPVPSRPLKRKLQTILDIVGIVFILDVVGSILALVAPHRISDNTIETMIGISIIFLLFFVGGAAVYGPRAKGRLLGHRILIAVIILVPLVAVDCLLEFAAMKLGGPGSGLAAGTGLAFLSFAVVRAVWQQQSAR
jgi:peptidoglycan/LPS O-acetylase OafA/YrhL